MTVAVDTNILARFYCDDPSDTEAKRQRPAAQRVMLGSTAVFVPVTVVLEFEWVMRAFYDAQAEAFCACIEHLLGMSHVTVERWPVVKDALDLHRQGLDFADALHWASSAACASFVTFDDRGFVKRAKRLGRAPEVMLAR